MKNQENSCSSFWYLFNEEASKGSKLAANLHIKTSLDILCSTGPNQEFLKRYRVNPAKGRNENYTEYNEV